MVRNAKNKIELTISLIYIDNSIMLTRSQTKKVQFAVNIDFDEASRAWRENKKVLKNGCFTYVEPITKKYNLRSCK